MLSFWKSLLGNAGGGIAAIAMLAAGLLLIISGSFALEAWTHWPDWATIGIMLVLAAILPPVGGIIGLVGLFYLPFWH